ncbi:hypothetical protein [Blautia argi]|uniref:hypothetical protein n=1 Tax=Blautia argi TaxID=1912897 RepID=UPI001FA8C82D|nr:hypothetical protein [Blautia argi]
MRQLVYLRKGNGEFYPERILYDWSAETNRVIYPCGIRQKVSEFALHLRKTDRAVSLVTVGGREFYVYRYEGELNDIPNAVVIISYPREAFGNPKSLRVFISTNAGISHRKSLTHIQNGGQSNYFPSEQKQTCAGQMSDPLTAGNRAVLADHVIGSLHVLYAFWEIQYLRGRIPVFSRSSQNRANR